MYDSVKLRIQLANGKLDLDIRVEDSCRLKPHEEVVLANVEKLERDIIISGKLRNPVIIDGTSKVILDGTHRWAVLHRIGLKWIPVCEVDYFNDLIRLERWIRLYRTSLNINIELFLERMGISYEKDRLLEEDDDSFLLITGKNAYRIYAGSLLEAYKYLRKIENGLYEAYNIIPSYLSKMTVQDSSTRNIIVVPPKPTKKEVVNLALSGYLLPPKSTRHIIPARPLGLDIPLRLLRQNEDPGSIIEMLIKHKKPILLHSPVLLDRRYEEVIIYFI